MIVSSRSQMKTRWGDGPQMEGREERRKTGKKEAKSMVHSVGLQGDPPGQQARSAYLCATGTNIHLLGLVIATLLPSPCYTFEPLPFTIINTDKLINQLTCHDVSTEFAPLIQIFNIKIYKLLVCKIQNLFCYYQHLLVPGFRKYIQPVVTHFITYLIAYLKVIHENFKCVRLSHIFHTASIIHQQLKDKCPSSL